jgi:hypothetical protein
MDTLFPFGLPDPTAFYLVLFVATLIIHVAFMNYVLAGTAYLAFGALWTRLHPAAPASAAKYAPTISGILTDWMPAMLSAAITAGVAPLLFVQLLYKYEFYTANLLLFNRWMFILPVLIVGFYGLYVLKSEWLKARPPWVRLVAALLPFGCAVFVAYSWTENHLLSVAGADKWQAFYVSEWQVYYEPQLIPRLTVWAFGSMPTLAVWLGWQMWYRQRAGEPADVGTVPHLSQFALVGIGLTLAGALGYYLVTDDRTRGAFFTNLAGPYFGLAVLGVLLQIGAWWRQRTLTAFHPQLLGLATAGVALTLTGMSVCREAIRLRELGSERLTELAGKHAEVLKVDGFWAFLFFAALNLAACVACFVIVWRGWKPPDSPTSVSPTA